MLSQTRLFKFITKRLTLISVLLFAISACTTIKPIDVSIPEQPQRFSHADFDEVLSQFVDDHGKLNYRKLKAQPEQFEHYYQQIASHSPDSTPAAFKHQADQLAYWINAYNAAVIKTVLSYYPINSIENVKPPWPLFFLPDKTGFFLFQKPVFGQATASLYYLENSVIRERFQEPRVHFALNCASLGCPELPRYAFNGDNLHQQLEFEARKFFSASRNLKIDHKNKTIFVSSILEWYKDDFVNWYQKQHPGQKANLINYIALYAGKEQSDFLMHHGQNYELEFTPYDWSLNDQNPAYLEH